MDDDLIDRLEQTLLHPAKRYQLLQQRETLQDILTRKGVRRWLYEQAVLGQAENRDPRMRSRQVRQLVIQIMQHSGCIRQRGMTDPEVYEEALARTWEWFSRDFEKYNPELSSFVTWFNRRLSWIIQDIFKEMGDRQNRYQQIFYDNEADVNPIEAIPDRHIEPDRYQQILQEWITLVKCDPSRQLRNCRMQNYAHLDCQRLILAILHYQLLSLGKIDWIQIGQELNAESRALSRFWQNNCRKKFRQLLREKGY